MVKLLKGMTHNGRVITVTEPIWSIPFNLFTVYLVLLMMELGLTEREIGLTQSILILTQIISSLFSGKLADKMGGRYSVLLFDLISWGAACVIWAVSNSFIGFAAAAFLNGVNKVVQVSFSYLLVQGADHDQRLKNYTGLHIMVVAGGLFTPICGVIISKFGLINGVRGIYIAAAIIYITMFILRHFAFIEPEAHPEKKEIGVLEGVIDSFKFFASTSHLRRVFLLQAIGQFFLVFKPIFYFAFLKESVGLTSFEISIVPVIFSGITIGLMLWVVPKVKKDILYLTVGFFLGIISMILLILSAKLGVVVLFGSIVLDAVNTAFMKPVLSNYWVSQLDARKNTTQLGAGFFLFGLFGVPAGIIAGESYRIDPALPFAAAAILLTISFIIGVLLLRERT